MFVAGNDRIIFIIEGQANIVTTASTSTRPSLSHVLMMLPRESLQFVKRRLFAKLRFVRTMKPGDILECSIGAESEHSTSIVARSRCVTVELGSEQAVDALLSWARSKNVVKIPLNAEP
jgi:hypothetical protein